MRRTEDPGAPHIGRRNPLDAPKSGVAAALPLRDPAALGALFERERPKLQAVALRYTKDPENAADVVQNAFEKIVRNGHQFRGQSKLSTWIHRVVANEALMWLRSERRRRVRIADVEDPDRYAGADPAPGSEAIVVGRDELDRLYRALDQLDVKERRALSGCALDERSYAEWAADEGLHPAAVKSRVFRARGRLRELLR